MSDFLLLNPPAEVRQACCAGLEQRAVRGRGGTAASVPFASRVCAGGPVTQDDLVAMLTHMAAIEDAMIERGLADPSLSVAWLLWGGDEGRDWAEGFVLRERPVVAAPAPAEPVVQVVQDPEAPGWMVALNRLSEAEAELLARIHELMEAGVEFAVGRLRSKVVNSLSRPSAALKAACGGLTQRDALLASIAAAPSAAEACALVPGPILAKVTPSIELDDSLRQVFVQLSSRLRDLVGAHQEATAALLGEGGVPDVLLSEARHLWRGDLESALTSATDELMGIVARTARQAAEAPPDGEIPTGRVPASLAFRLLSGAGGGDPNDPARQDYVLLGEGEVLAAGVALGVTSLRAIGRASMGGALHAAKVAGTLVFTEGPEFAITARTTWRWGGSARPFPPHQQLDGRQWDTEGEREDVCRNPGRFPAVGTLYPGDHLGCSCSLTVQLVLKQTKAARATFTPNSPTPTSPPPPGPPPTPVTTVVKAKPPVVPRRGQRKPIDIFTTDSKDASPRQRSQIETMSNQLRDLTGKQPKWIYLVDKFKGYEGKAPHQMPNGLGTRGPKPGQGYIWLNNRHDSDEPERAGRWLQPNHRKVTSLENTLIHEWGHISDVDPAKTKAFFDKVKSNQLRVGTMSARLGDIWPSDYSKTNDAELFAEAFADWHIDSAAAHPLSKLMAQEFGWKPARLADFSAARKRDDGG